MAITINNQKVELIKLKNGTYVTSLKDKQGNYLWTPLQRCVESFDYCATSNIWNSRIKTLDPAAHLWEKSGYYLGDDGFKCNVGDVIEFGAFDEPPSGYIYSTDRFTIDFRPTSVITLFPHVNLIKYPNNIEATIVVDSWEIDPNGRDHDPSLSASYYTYFKFYNPNSYGVTITYTVTYLNYEGYEYSTSSTYSQSLSGGESSPSWIIVYSNTNAGQCLGMKVTCTLITPDSGNQVTDYVIKSDHYDYWLSEPETTTTTTEE